MTGPKGLAAAEALALQALAFLAGEPERLAPFLEQAGLGPHNLRAAAAEPGFLAAVLDHISSSDSLLMETADNLGVDPEALMRAREALASAPPEDF